MQFNFNSLSYNVSAGLSTEMGTYFFLVTSFTCVTYLWSNMAAPAPVITSAFQLVGQKIILPFGSDISPLLKFHWGKYLPWSWQTWGWWVHRRAGKCDHTSEHSCWPQFFIHIPIFILLWFSPHSSLSVFASRYGYG